jgi:hypothetical protein
MKYLIYVVTISFIMQGDTILQKCMQATHRLHAPVCWEPLLYTFMQLDNIQLLHIQTGLCINIHINQWTSWNSCPSWEADSMVAKGSLSCSQDPTTKVDESSPHPTTLVSKIHSKIILPPTYIYINLWTHLWFHWRWECKTCRPLLNVITRPQDFCENAKRAGPY